VDIAGLVRQTIRDVGYTRAKFGFDYETCGVLVCIDEQSPDIAQGVNVGGAGDQGMMFGFACDETPELMPAPIQLAHQLARRLSTARRDGTLRWARPDGKTQVTVEYDESGRPRRVDTVLVSVQHSDEVSNEQLFSDVQEHVVNAIVPPEWLDADTKRYVNPTGRFVVGGPQGDSGLTGRKIIVDTYGGYARHGGGAFSGKDPTKVDRSAAYAARWVAKNLVAAGLATRCEIQLAYAIGVAHPVSVMIETFGTERVPVPQIEALVDEYFDLSPIGIISALQLRRPIYRQVAAFGHFGRSDLDLPWEKTEIAAELAAEAGVEPLPTAGNG
jgi:S-adenosylmethionine synthetase